MAPAAITDPFSLFGAAAKTKLLLLGSPERWLTQVRSLHIEHVSPAGLRQREISRHPDSTGNQTAQLALLRRWFFARKPDAGFFLTEFPATLLQAKVFDEWLESRHEGLDAVFAGPGSPAPVVAHYLAHGLLAEDPSPMAPAMPGTLSPIGPAAK